MAVRKRQTAWDILTKLALKTVRTRFETIECGSKQKQNERFAWGFPQNTALDPVRHKRMAVRKRQTARDILTKSAVLMVRTRFERRGLRFEDGKPRGTPSHKFLFSRFLLGSKEGDSHYFGYAKKGQNFNHAHGQFHTPDFMSLHKTCAEVKKKRGAASTRG